MEVYCTNLEQYIPVNSGETLAGIWEKLRDKIGFEPICAKVNNKVENLDYEVFRPKQVEFLPITSRDGASVYQHSLTMLLYRASLSLVPDSVMRVEQAVARGLYVIIHGFESTKENAFALKSAMESLVRRNLPLCIGEKRTSDLLPDFERQGLRAKAELLRTIRPLYTTFYTLDGIKDSYYGPLATHTGCLRVFDVLPYHEGFLLMSFDPSNPSTPQTPTKQEKMFEAFREHKRFNRICDVENIGQLNRVVERGVAADIVNVAEALHEKSISQIAEKIALKHAAGGARFVLIAGPSSSGKTTTTKRLGIQLTTRLLRPQLISLDNYFVERDRTPRDETGDYDFESLYALDLELFNDHLNALIRGEEVELPYYNFETGKREYRGEKIRLDAGSILLIEGIHGLNPELTANVPEEMKYRVYVSALTTLAIDYHNHIPTSDNRLIRRIVRDAKYRGISADETIRRWPSVRRGEEKWIFPYQENADAMFNSSLLFELAVLKDFAENQLRNVPSDLPEFSEAFRLKKFLSYFLPIDSAMVPSTSLLREFIGGSSFRY